MRILVVRKPGIRSIDGVHLDTFEPGVQYEVGNSLGALMLAEGWAVPVPLDEPAAAVPFAEADPFGERPYRDSDAPPNLTREHYPPSLGDGVYIASELERRKRRRRR